MAHDRSGPDAEGEDMPTGGESFAERLRRLREGAGLSQVALAGDDLHPSYVSLLESGRRSPTDAAIAVLAARLGVSPEELAGTSGLVPAEALAMAEAALGLGRPAEALELLSGAVAGLSAQRFAVDALAFRAGEAYATALERLGRLHEAIGLGERLREAAEAAPGRLPWLRVTTALVRNYRDAGDAGRAIDLGEAVLQRLAELRLERADGQAALVSTLASAYVERGDLTRAGSLLDGLIASTDESGTLDERAYARWNAAYAAAFAGRGGEALELAGQAAALLAVGDDVRSQARLAVTRAWIMLSQDEPDAAGARKLLREALPHLRQHASIQAVASAEAELARAELLLGRPEVARRLASTALKRLEPDERNERARTLAVLGASLVQLGERQLGVAALEEAAEQLNQTGVTRQAAAAWRQLSEVYRACGDLEKALEAAERAMTAVGVPAEHVTLGIEPKHQPGQRARAR